MQLHCCLLLDRSCKCILYICKISKFYFFMITFSLPVLGTFAKMHLQLRSETCTPLGKLYILTYCIQGSWETHFASPPVSYPFFFLESAYKSQCCTAELQQLRLLNWWLHTARHSSCMVPGDNAHSCDVFLMDWLGNRWGRVEKQTLDFHVGQTRINQWATKPREEYYY